MRINRDKTNHIARIATLSALFAVESPAFAEEQKGESGSLLVFAGAGVINRPQYPGSDSTETRAMPLISLRYKRFFLGGLNGLETGLGLMMYQTPTIAVALVGTRDIDKPRDQSYDQRFTGVRDIERSTLAGFYTSYSKDWYSLHSSILTDVENGSQGTVINIGGSLNRTLYQRLNLSVSSKTTWGNDEHMDTFFAVTDQDAAQSDLARYSTQAGLATVEFGVGARYQLTPRLGIATNATQQYFLGDAKDSPLIHKQHQTRLGVFMMYRF